ncbi:MAG: NAD(P)H-hydrate dehydratase [Acidimicrobiia bacterium]|nr:NAD(P)H-hydrate dehydratase [Acidimicrobiia bacterium]
MEPVLTPTEMGEADRRAIAAGTPVRVLMDRAGRAVAWEVRRVLGSTYGHRVAIVCGKGNNGGDGLVAARVLSGWGVRVEVLDLGAGLDVATADAALDRADLLVDAMYGTGFTGSLDGVAAYVARRSTGITTVAIDVPSGVDGLTGRAPGDVVHADSTVTFAARKPGVCFEPGRSCAGEVRLVDIGIDVGEPALTLTDASDFRRWLVPLDPAAHKWMSALLVVGGSGGMTGAPLLVSHAAMRVGAGIVWCGVPGNDAAARASGGEVVTKALPENPDGALTGLGELSDATRRFRGVVVGPGLGDAPATRAAVRDLVGRLAIPLVLDADGLNAFEGDAGIISDRTAPTILTPHAGEYARIAGEPVGDDRVAAARHLAKTTGAVVLLKGPGTVVAEPGGRAAINPHDGPWLGTAGSGDVLSGIVGGLLARGLEPFEAATGGAFLHARAADRAGHTGLIAGDLVAALPRTLESLEH